MIIFDYSILAISLLVYIVTKSLFAFCASIAFCMYFMYSPNLAQSYESNYFYSPSNGSVRYIHNKGDKTVISLFLNILDNHTQYIPIKSRLTSQSSTYGPFKPAYIEHSINNQQVETNLLSINHGFEYKIVQITGILTRRIKSLLPNNTQELEPGTRLGFIVLGSRVDVTIPTAKIKRLFIEPGQHIGAMDKIIELQK